MVAAFPGKAMLENDNDLICVSVEFDKFGRHSSKNKGGQILEPKFQKTNILDMPSFDSK